MFYYKLMARKLSLALGLIVLCSLTISGARKPSFAISFHLEGIQFEGPKMVQPIRLGNPPKTHFFRRVPELTQRHIKGYYPFPANDGASYGVAFKLNKSGSDALAVISTVNQGKKLLTVVDGEPVDTTVLDKPIRDGHIVVWGGLTKSDLAKFDKKFTRIKPATATGAKPLMPERATRKKVEAEPAPPITDDGAAAEPKKERRRLFGRRKKKES